jgi:hypothetical protein
MTLFRRSRLSFIFAVLTATGLLYDAKVHLHLADDYDVVGSGVTQGLLFRIEAAVAIGLAIAVLVSDHRLVWAAAGLTGLGGVLAVLLYRYVDVGAIGPIPNMYEPAWFPEKLHSAYAEGAVAVMCAAREIVRTGMPSRSWRRHVPQSACPVVVSGASRRTDRCRR